MTLAKQLNQNHHLSHGLSKTTRQDWMCSKCKLIFASKSEKGKAKRKHKTPPPPCVSLGQSNKKKRERNCQGKRTKTRKQSQHFSLIALLSSSRLTHLLPNQKFKTHPKEDQGKEKGRSKQGRKEERRRKPSKQVYLQELHQNSSLTLCIFPFLR